VGYQKELTSKEQENMKTDITQRLAMTSYYGVPVVKVPATKQELINGGSAVIEHSPYYVEDEKPYNA